MEVPSETEPRLSARRASVPVAVATLAPDGAVTPGMPVAKAIPIAKAVPLTVGAADEEDGVLLGGSVRLVGMRMFKRGKRGQVRVYILELSNGSDKWFVAKRYSEFLDCHTELSEQLGSADELPAFPPKEPLIQRFFSARVTRQEFIGERQLQLQEYIEGVLENPRTAHTRTLYRFLQKPEAGALLSFIAGPSEDAESGMPTPRGSRTWSGLMSPRDSCAADDFPRVHARLTGRPGELDIVVRGRVRRGLQSRQVRLTMGATNMQDGIVVKAFSCDVALADTADGTGEVTHRIRLDPGHLWEIQAQWFDGMQGTDGQGTVNGELVGQPASLSLHVPATPPGYVDPEDAKSAALERLRTSRGSVVDGADEAAGGPGAGDAEIGTKVNKAPAREKFETAPNWAVRFR